MGRLGELVTQFIKPVQNLSIIEGNTEMEDGGRYPFAVVPIEQTAIVTNPEIIFDAASLHLQRAAKRIGLKLPDLRYRAIVNPYTNPPNVVATSWGTFTRAQQVGYDLQVDFEFERLQAEIDALQTQEDDSSLLLEG